MVTAGTAAKRGKGKRKKKGEGSLRSGAKTAGAEEGSAGGQGGDEGGEEEEEEADGEGDGGLLDEGGEKVDRAAEKKNLA